MFDFSVGREMLQELLLRDGGDRGIGAEQNGARRGRALVDRKYVRCQTILPASQRTAFDGSEGNG